MKEANYKSLGTFLKNRREELKLSQRQLGEKVGAHSQFVSNWERGICYPPTKCFKLLVKALQLKTLKLEIESAIRQDLETTLRVKFKGLI